MLVYGIISISKGESEMDKFERIRKEQFPAADKFVFMDTSTTGLFSTRARDAMVDHIEKRYENGMDMDDYMEGWEMAEEMRGTVAEMIGASSEEIFFSGSGSDMLNVFSNGIELPSNANVVTSGLSFPSTPYNWINRVGRENVRVVDHENGCLPAEKLFEACDENTAVIALCAVENTSGWRHDLKAISEFCQKNGIYLVLDTTQCIGAMKIDVSETPVDYLIATTYKWISGLFGISFAYISKRVIDKVRPTAIGWTGAKDKFDSAGYNREFSGNANKFETGGLCWIGLKSIRESIGIYLELGRDDVEARILELTDYLYERVAETDGLGIWGPFPEKNRSCITVVTFPEEWALTDQMFKDAGIRTHVSYPGKVRIALHYFNNREDIDKLIGFFKEQN